MEKPENRIMAGIQLAAILCWISVVLSLLVANLIYLLGAILYAVAAVGLHRKQFWGARLALTLSIIFGIIELILIGLNLLGFFGGTVRYSSIPTRLTGQIIRLAVQIGIIIFTGFSWRFLRGTTPDDYEKRGTV